MSWRPLLLPSSFTRWFGGSRVCWWSAMGVELLAAHMVGDFVLQTRWQATGKFGWTARALRLRTTHVVTYVLPFVVVVAYRRPGWVDGPLFLYLLAALHWWTDSRRFTSTVGDYVVWLTRIAPIARGRNPGRTVRLTANPWPSLPLAIDQTLHVVQVAVLGALLL